MGGGDGCLYFILTIRQELFWKLECGCEEKTKLFMGYLRKIIPAKIHTVTYLQREKSSSKVDRTHVPQDHAIAVKHCINPLLSWVIISFIPAPPTLLYSSRLLSKDYWNSQLLNCPGFRTAHSMEVVPASPGSSLKPSSINPERPPPIPSTKTPQDSSRCTLSLLGGLYLNGIYHYSGKTGTNKINNY